MTFQLDFSLVDAVAGAFDLALELVTYEQLWAVGRQRNRS
jgi:hypothetical protein